MGNYLYRSYLLSYLLYEVFLKTLDASATQYLQEGETNNWLDVSAKVGLGNLLTYSHNFLTALVNKDRYKKWVILWHIFSICGSMPYKQQMPHFHLFDYIKNTSMNNCSIYIRWKTKFPVFTVWKYFNNNFSVDWKRVNSIFFAYW